MKIRCVLAAVSILWMALPVSSAVANEKDYTRSGGYLVLGGLNGFQQFQNTPPLVRNIDNTLGFMIQGGYRANSYLAVELEGDFISGFDADVATGLINPSLPAVSRLTLDGGAVTANVLGYLPFGRVQPFGLVGLGGMWTRLRSSGAVAVACGPGFAAPWYFYCRGAYAQLGNSGGFVMRFGGGVDLYATEDWALTVNSSYVMPFGSISDFSYVQLGWGVRFTF